MLLPCDHILCNSCLPQLTQSGMECPVCNQHYSDGDPRRAPYIENMVTIFRSLDATVCTSLSQTASSDAERVSGQGPTPVKDTVDKTKKEAAETPREGNSSAVPSIFSLTPNKRLDALSNNSTKDGIGKNKNVGNAKYGILEMDTNQIEQLSPGSPPSSNDIKGLRDDSSDHGSERSEEKYSAKRSSKRNSDNRFDPERIEDFSFGTDGHVKDPKRQKKLNYGLSERGVKSESSQPVISNSVNSSVSDSDLEPKFGTPLSGSQPSRSSVSFDANLCAFCLSSKVSEASGPMMHYDASGNPLGGDHLCCPNVTHVHQKCIDWAPKTYYVGETVKNLKRELARAAKLKCNSCGLKGAALGCYVESCRKSYHVPCAVDIWECRWDIDNYLVLCPSHSSSRFPNEKPDSGPRASKKHPLSSPVTSQQCNFWAASPGGQKEWVLCGSDLSSDEKFILGEFRSMSGVIVSRDWNPNITHVIAATDVNGACIRTLKVLMAILNGKWVLKIDWIKACIKAGRPLDEEPYEVCLDNHGCIDGPKIGRLRALQNAPKILDGLHFHLSGDFPLAFKDQLQRLVIAAGGIILQSKEDLMAKVHDGKTSVKDILVVFNLESPNGCKMGDEAKTLAAEIGSKLVRHTWILESIASSKLQPLAS